MLSQYILLSFRENYIDLVIVILDTFIDSFYRALLTLLSYEPQLCDIHFVLGFAGMKLMLKRFIMFGEQDTKITMRIYSHITINNTRKNVWKKIKKLMSIIMWGFSFYSI